MTKKRKPRATTATKKTRKKASSSSRKKKPGASIFDFLKFLTVEKKPWEELTDVDRKNFSPYMINRWLSMNRNFIDVVNDFQKYAIGIITPKEVYNFYLDVLPQAKFWAPYITSKGEKHNKELIELVALYYEVSTREAKDYVQSYKATHEGTELLVEMMVLYGMDDKKQRQLLK